MKDIKIYHGSDHIIEKPMYQMGDLYSDYGQGFYCTSEIEIAKEWANRKFTSGYVNKYNLDIGSLNVLDLTDKNRYSVLNWIAILMHHRQLSNSTRSLYKNRLDFLEKYFYIDVQKYDVIIGYRADDAYFKFPIYFLQNEISIEKLEEIYLLGDLGTEIAIISEKAFSHLNFINAFLVEPMYHEYYQIRKRKAIEMFETIRTKEINNNKEKIEDLMKKYD